MLTTYCKHYPGDDAAQNKAIIEVVQKLVRQPTQPNTSVRDQSSLILFDILSNQNFNDCSKERAKPEVLESFESNQQELESFVDIEHLLRTLNLAEYLDTFNEDEISLSTLVRVD
nr:uncharacterized protein LOC107439714 [Parasteatoda tepidariorum]